MIREDGTFRVFVLGMLSIVALVVWWPVFVTGTTTGAYLQVRFLDVGQGDAVHILTPDGFEMLVDGGSTSVVLRRLATGRSFFDRKIDMVVATHPDSDHVGGLVDVLERYDVDLIVETNTEHEAPAARAYARAAVQEGAERLIAQAGQIIQLGASTTVRILSPQGDTSNWDNNASSIVLQIIYGDTEIMLTGDAPQGIEEYLVRRYGETLESEILKLGHHGSDTSSSESFLQVVNSKYAVVSAGVDNRYGHPKPQVLLRAGAAGAQTVSTAEQGSILFKSDGKRVWLE